MVCLASGGYANFAHSVKETPEFNSMKCTDGWVLTLKYSTLYFSLLAKVWQCIPGINLNFLEIKENISVILIKIF